jgi:hypothetical protein
LCEHVVRISGDTAILSFSAGKGSVACWLQMRRRFKRVIPFYLELIPGLEFVEEGLRYYETFFGEPIIRIPHPSLWRWLGNLIFQPPERRQVIEDARLPRYGYEDVENHIRAVVGIPAAFVGIGSRTADSPNRLANIKRFGACNYRRRSFFPVYDWKINDIVREFRAAGVGLPVDYDMFGRSFDGLDYRFVQPIRDRYPEDYRRILDLFPLAEMELMRREMVTK